MSEQELPVVTKDGDIEIRELPLAELHANPDNPRYIDERSFAGLSSSVKRFGLVEPIVWNKRSGRVVGGHQRLKVLEERGVERTKVVVVDLDDREEQALNVTLNNPAIAGAFDKDLPELLEQLEADLGDTFEELNLSDLLASFPKPIESFPEYDKDVREKIKRATCPKCGEVFVV